MQLDGKKFNPLNRKYVPDFDSYLLASKAIQTHFMKAMPLSDGEIRTINRNYSKGIENINRGMKGKKGEDYRVVVYSFAFGDYHDAAGFPDYSDYYERLITNKDRGAVLTEIERIAEPDRNSRMDKRPIRYHLRNSEMLFFLMDAGHEFSQDFSPAIATLDLGSRLESMPMILGTDTYYMTYDQKKDDLHKLHAKYPQIIALQRFKPMETMAIAYNVAGVSVLMDITSSDPDVFRPQLKKALECFESAVTIKLAYPDILEGMAYARRLLGDRKAADFYYDKANEIRLKLAKEYRLFVEGKLEI